MKKYWIRKNSNSNEVGLISLSENQLQEVEHWQYKNENFVKPIVENDTIIEGATDEELKAIEKSKVPFSVKNIQLRKALIQFGIMPSTITKALNNLPSETEKEKITRELMINLWEYEDEMRRASPDIIGFGANFKLFENELDKLFILASTL
jgi:hypothetical protein